MTTVSRLDETGFLYDLVEGLADRLETGGMDLWAANLRGCLDADTTGERLAHVGLELARLRSSPAARRLSLGEDVARLETVVTAAVGPPDPLVQPLYDALKDLVDRLRLEGLTAMLARLRSSRRATLPGASAAETVPAAPSAVVAELRTVLAGLPAKASPGAQRAAEAASLRLDRVPAEIAARALALALRRPR